MATPTLGWVAKAAAHPGSSLEEIIGEPEWEAGHAHRTGYKNTEGRVPGHTTEEPDYGEEEEEEEALEKKLVGEARQRFDLFRQKARDGKLINFRDVVNGLEDFQLVHPSAPRSAGWRYVLECTEEWIKYGQEWPANIKRRAKEEGENGAAVTSKKKKGKTEQLITNGRSQNTVSKEKQQEVKSLKKENPLLLQSLREEARYIASLENNDGHGRSPKGGPRLDISIDEADQFTPDHWVPRAPELIRNTGTHPLNAEPPLQALLDEDLITPNEIHYVRNHGAVPRLLWELHQLEITHGDSRRMIGMDCLINQFRPINIPVVISCDGNRRGELNMIKTSKGFDWGAGAVGCAYWRGPLLRDVLLACGVPDPLYDSDTGSTTTSSTTSRQSTRKRRQWVNFEGADKLGEGTYQTCIPLDYAMDPLNDVLLALEMNDKPLPPDHGYPVRVVIPGHVGGRCVKWLKRIWSSEEENDSHYHIWDNRVLPTFVQDWNDELAETLFRHPNTACNELPLNSVIVQPGHGEKLTLLSQGTYRIRGYAYAGGGNAVEKVEISLDGGGESWLYCTRKFPDYPIRHSKKFWTWVHWHVDVPVVDLLNAHSIVVRCFDIFKNTQPEGYNWNIMGMMNNRRYEVRMDIIETPNDNGSGKQSTGGEKAQACLVFRHPTAQGKDKTGWMKPSLSNQMAAAKAKETPSVPQKQFTRQEIESHDKKDDCWLVIDGCVYDATSVMSWHPGGIAPLMAHAGKVHQSTSDEFNSIHDGYARGKLNECILGTVTEKTAKLIEQLAAKEEEEKKKQDDKQSESGRKDVALQQHRRWTPVKLIKRKAISDDTRVYTFQLPDGKKYLGLGNGQHLQIGLHLKDKMLIRAYTPTRPVLPGPKDGRIAANGANHHDGIAKLQDGQGTFDLTVKTYFPDENQPGGAMSNILDAIQVGESVDLRGPTGEILYHGHGNFTIENKPRHFRRISLVLGGSGVTPGYSILSRVVLTPDDLTEIRIVNGNRTEGDILMKEELEDMQRSSNGRLKITYVLSKPSDKWKGLKGHVTEEVMRDHLFPAAEDSVALLCGPPGMIQRAVLPGLRNMGYVEDQNIFGF